MWPLLKVFKTLLSASAHYGKRALMGDGAQAEWPLLVVTPASLRLNWAEELERWLPLLRPAHVRVIEGREDRLRPGDTPRVCMIPSST